jgi:hypothetical protein
MPDPRDSIISNLNQQLDQFFGAGKTVQEIPRGVSAKAPMFGTTPHSLKLKTARTKDAPKVKALADAGKSVVEIARETGILAKRLRLIASENNFKFAEPS